MTPASVARVASVLPADRHLPTHYRMEGEGSARHATNRPQYVPTARLGRGSLEPIVACRGDLASPPGGSPPKSCSKDWFWALK